LKIVNISKAVKGIYNFLCKTDLVCYVLNGSFCIESSTIFFPQLFCISSMKVDLVCYSIWNRRTRRRNPCPSIAFYVWKFIK